MTKIAAVCVFFFYKDVCYKSALILCTHLLYRDSQTLFHLFQPNPSEK